MPKQAQKSGNEFEVISKFNFGYRNREDRTNLPPQTLVVGSQNVLTNVSGRFGSRQGYTLDGAADTSNAPILSSFDWPTHTNQVRHLRAGFLTSAANDGKLQYRYVASDGTVTWRDLKTAQTSTYFNFTDYWDSTNSQAYLLWVNGASTITEWTGGITTVLSVTTNTITTVGTSTWAELGFYSAGNHSVVINGASYAYTGGHGTTTLTGVTPDPLAAGVVAGDIVHQLPEAWSNTAGLPATFDNQLIANLRNQIYIGSLTNQSVYVSKVNNYKDYAFAVPRVVGEGAIVTLDGTPKALVPQEDRMYMSGGMDLWYETKFTLSSDLTKESFEISLLKTAPQQASQTQGLTAKMKNNVIFVSNEVAIDSMGREDNIFATPNIRDLSYPIVNDVSTLDFTDGQIIYFKKQIYVSAPASSNVFVYNMTSDADQYWEAPQVLPIGRFSIIDGELYGHSYQTSETYKLFDGYNDNGYFIDARALFAFNSHGDRAVTKSFNEFYVEGYISSNTTLNLGYQFDLDGCATTLAKEILGTDMQIVCIATDENLLGKYPLGKKPLGAGIALVTSASLPPKFRVIKTNPRLPYYEYQASFTSSGLDQQWEIIAFGPLATPTTEGQNNIVQ